MNNYYKEIKYSNTNNLSIFHSLITWRKTIMNVNSKFSSECFSPKILHISMFLVYWLHKKKQQTGAIANISAASNGDFGVQFSSEWCTCRSFSLLVLFHCRFYYFLPSDFLSQSTDLETKKVFTCKKKISWWHIFKKNKVKSLLISRSIWKIIYMKIWKHIRRY